MSSALKATDAHDAPLRGGAPARTLEAQIKEIQHRVKNNLQVISSLLSLQSRYAPDSRTAEMFRASQNRVRSMALIYERLYRSDDPSRVPFTVYVRSLVSHLCGAYTVDRERIRVVVRGGEDLALDIDAAVPCGLILTELVSNACVHAFPDGRRGEVRVAIRVHEDGHGELEVADDGIGLPPQMDPHRTETLGLKLVAALTEQLGGRLEVGREHGTTVRVAFKAAASFDRS